jgi:hypothetical protein
MGNQAFFDLRVHRGLKGETLNFSLRALGSGLGGYVEDKLSLDFII